MKELPLPQLASPAFSPSPGLTTGSPMTDVPLWRDLTHLPGVILRLIAMATMWMEKENGANVILTHVHVRKLKSLKIFVWYLTVQKFRLN